MSLIAGVLAALVAGPATAQQGPAALKPVQLLPSLTYERQVQFTSHGPVAINVLTAPRPGGAWALKPVLSNETITGTETVTAMEKRVSSQATVAGVNGDLYNLKDGHPSGILVRGGVLDHQPLSGRSSIGIDAQGGLHVDRVALYATWQGSGPRHPFSMVNEAPAPSGFVLFTPAYGPTTPSAAGATEAVLSPFPPPTTASTDIQGPVVQVKQNGKTPIPAGGAVLSSRGPAAAQAIAAEAQVGQAITVRPILQPDWLAITDAIGGGPLLVRNGAPVFRALEDFTSVQVAPRAPRTGIGQLTDGRIVLVAVDGRQPGYSTGMSNFELAQTLVRLGAVTGAALDSGGSTTMAFDGKLLNQPSDPSGERRVAEALLVEYSGTYAPLPSVPVVSPNGDGVADQVSLAYKVVRPSSVTVNLLGPDGAPRYTFTGQVQPGTFPYTWNAKRPDGTPEAEGRWTWSVSATDERSVSTSMQRTFFLNDTLGGAKTVPPPLVVPRPSPRVVATFTLTHPALVTERIETAAGVVLRTVLHGRLQPGQVDVQWDGTAKSGAVVYPGRYVARVLATNDFGPVDLSAPFTVVRARTRS
jgi:exopolysaccharide biosynthesis protein